MLSQGHVFARRGTAAVVLGLVCPVLAQALLSVRSIVKVNVRDDGLDRGPDAPEEAGDAAERIDLGHELPGFLFLVHRCARQLGEGLDVLANESMSLRAGGNGGIVAAVADPFGKVVRNVECHWRRCSVFIVDEADGRLGAALSMDDDVGTQQVTVGKYQLRTVSNELFICLRWRLGQATYPVVS